MMAYCCKRWQKAWLSSGNTPCIPGRTRAGIDNISQKTYKNLRNDPFAWILFAILKILILEKGLLSMLKWKNKVYIILDVFTIMEM